MLATTVEQEVGYGSPGLSQSAVRELLSRVKLHELSLGQATAGLSGGERQRLALARALAVDPQVLLLDEPTSSLDAQAAEAVDQVIKDLVAEGLSVVLVSHDLDRAAAVTDDALVLDKGKLVDRGDPRSVRYLVE
jgi:putative ABC transport system ATP-binding protein